jgi:hypothetical protein
MALPGDRSYPGDAIIASARPQGPLEMAPLLIDPEATIGASMRELEGYSASSSEIGRRMGFAFGGHAPWGVIGMLQGPPPEQPLRVPEAPRRLGDTHER